MSLLGLANELLQSIAEFLSAEKDINAFSRANRRLYNILNTYLYRHNVRHGASSALLWAAQHGQEATAQRLLGEGANVQTMTFARQTPLAFAAGNGHEAVVNYYLRLMTPA
ncbi:F-box domain protein [Macrophomina phaseolina]|uniref:F-box domain protein n=1 Tax=Macrophomina phaseolina TaxID=35725 RepID=A0ABQ8G1U7_9PEZI|nr:F-box domain protein [Macrophomina phaseolina]